MKRAPSTAVRNLAVREVVTVASTATLRECAQAMRAKHVGCVVLVDGDGTQPLGVVTDRDIVVEAVAVGLDVATITAGDVATRPVATVHEDEDALTALARMRECGVRRLPVISATGQLNGLLALDDLIELLAEETGSVASVLGAERAREGATRR